MKLKKVIKYFVPHGLLELYVRIQQRKLRIGERALLFDKGYYTDLMEQESCGLLAFLLDLERREQRPIKYLEVGVWGGGTIKFLKEHTINVHFTGVDLFEDFQPADDNTHVCQTFKMKDVLSSLGGTVELIKGDSSHILPLLKDRNYRFDVIFIDGNHTYTATKRDFESCFLLLNKGGYIAFHNCSVAIPPDNTYIIRDGGPWKLTQEIRKKTGAYLELEIDRLRVFSFDSSNA